MERKGGDMDAGNKKYSDDGPFRDPVVRCDKCSTILKVEHIRETGCCTNCGWRRVRKIRNFNSDELNKMVEWGIDPDFCAMFRQVELD